MKNNQAEKSKNGNRKSNANDSRNQVQNLQATNAQSKTILKIKQAKPNELEIKALSRTSKGARSKRRLQLFEMEMQRNSSSAWRRNCLDLYFVMTSSKMDNGDSWLKLAEGLSEDASDATGATSSKEQQSP